MKSQHSQAAAAIRKELKSAFPTTKFSVTSESFSGGNAVRINYVDGPVTDAVNAIVSKYQEGSFNSQEDIYEYNNSNSEIPQVKYVQVSRGKSPETSAEILKEIQTTYHNGEGVGENDYFAEMGAYVYTLIHRIFSQRNYSRA